MSNLPWAAADAATFALALVGGFLSGAFNMGGQILMKPGIRLLGVSALDAVGTTVPLILPTVLVASARYARRDLIDWAAVRIAAPAGIVGTVGGAIAAPLVPGRGHLLQVATASLMLLVAVRVISDKRGRPGPGDAVNRPPQSGIRRGWVAGVGALSGIASGLLGIGGGFITVSGFSQAGRMPLRVAIATSMVCSGAFAIPATITHALLGTINWRVAILLTAGALPGAHLGARTALQMGERRLGLAVGLLMSLIAVIYGTGEVLAWLNK